MHLDTSKVTLSNIYFNFACRLNFISFQNKIIDNIHSGDTRFASWLRYLTAVVSTFTTDDEACLKTGCSKRYNDEFCANV